MTGLFGPLTTRRYLSLTTRAVARTLPRNSTLRIIGGLCACPTGLSGDLFRETFESVRERTRETTAPIPLSESFPLACGACVPWKPSVGGGLYFSPLTSIPIPYHLLSSAVHARRPSSPVSAESGTCEQRRITAKMTAMSTNPQMTPNAILSPSRSLCRAAADNPCPPDVV